MRFVVNYKKDIINSTQPYNSIIRSGYFELPQDVSNNKITVENIEYNLSKIWFDCEKHPINKRELHINAIYFEHVAKKKDPKDTSSPNKFVYVKIPVVKVDKSTAETYPHIRKMVKDIHEGDMQSNPKISISINNLIFNADKTTSIPSNNNLGKIATNIFTFSNTISGTLSTVTNVGYIVELAPLNVPEAHKFSVNDDAFDITVFTNTNVTIKSTPNNPNNNNTIASQNDVAKEGFAGLNDRIESFVEGLTCKRIANTGVINGTVMSSDFADKLIESQKHIGTATVIMFFVSLFAITMFYLFAKSYEEIEIAANPIVVAGGGELCDINEGSLFTGYITIIGMLCIILNLYGAVQLKEMYILIGAVIFTIATGIYYYLYANNFNIYDIEFEHVILYSRTKPFVKWLTISGYYMLASLWFALLFNPKLTTRAFYIAQLLFITFASLAYIFMRVLPDKMSSDTNIINKVNDANNVLNLLLNGVVNFPILLVLASTFLANITLMS